MRLRWGQKLRGCAAVAVVAVVAAAAARATLLRPTPGCWASKSRPQSWFFLLKKYLRETKIWFFSRSTFLLALASPTWGPIPLTAWVSRPESAPWPLGPYPPTSRWGQVHQTEQICPWWPHRLKRNPGRTRRQTRCGCTSGKQKERRTISHKVKKLNCKERIFEN